MSQKIHHDFLIEFQPLEVMTQRTWPRLVALYLANWAVVFGLAFVIGRGLKLGLGI